MDILDLTRQLGAAIQAEEAYIAFAAAKKANDEDTELQTQIGEFNLVRMSLDKEISAEERNDAKIDELNGKLRDLYSKIMTNHSMIAYNEAKSKLDVLVNQVNAIITKCINGEDPATCNPSSGCSGSCSSCSGCH